MFADRCSRSNCCCDWLSRHRSRRLYSTLTTGLIGVANRWLKHHVSCGRSARETQTARPQRVQVLTQTPITGLVAR